ncbi:HdeA/HdeB family chaperone, partial [Rhizobiaceae sp. 2RAB30]
MQRRTAIGQMDHTCALYYRSCGEGSAKEALIMRSYLTIALAAASIGLAGQALAKEVDMSKLTCKEVGAMPAGKTIGVAMWVNGFVHGKAGNAMIDSDMAQANAEKV